MKSNLIFLLLTLQLFSFGQTTNNSTIMEQKIARHDRAVHVMDDWMRDPFITIGPDGLYYLTCTQYTDETQGVLQPVYTSKDLASWTRIGFPYSLKNIPNLNDYLSSLEAKKKDGFKENLKLWAPEIHYMNNRWILVHTSNTGFGNLAYTLGEKYETPFAQWGSKFGKHHDPSLFQDDDGSIWLISKCAEIQKIKDDLSDFDGAPIRIEPSDRKLGHEGTQIIKSGDKYVLFGTGWSTDQMRHGTYNLYYCTASKVTGPYGPRKFAGRFLGHGTVFQDKNKNWWCTAFYNANGPALRPPYAKSKDLSDSAYTINQQGLTLVPLEIKMVNEDVVVKAKDEDYAFPGSEEIQKF